MKKTIALLLFAVALFSGSVSAQRHTYMSEGLLDKSPYLHSNLWDMTEKSALDVLYIMTSSEAGGEAPEMLFGYDPSVGLKDVLNGTYRLTSVPFFMKAGHENYVSVKYNYTAAKTSAENARVFGLAVRRGTEDWTEIARLNPMSANMGQGLLVGMLPESLREARNVQFSVFYKSTADNISHMLYFDDMEFFGIEDGYYAADFGWSGRPYTADGRLNVDLLLKNTGNLMTSCVLSYTFNDGEVHTKALSFGNGLYPDEIYTINKFEPEGWAAGNYGKHSLEFWLSEVNGEAVAEDKIVKQTKYLTNLNPETAESYPYRPLVEQFSSSTCGPCASYNRQLNPELAKLGDTLTLVKYQMDWPGNGDPYYTEEGGARRGYYGINSVPSFVVNGVSLNLTQYETISSMVGAMLKGAGKDTYFSIVLDEASVDASQQVRVTVKVKAVGGMENVRLHTVVMERTTTGNAATNGETEFHNVMLKMLPDVGGALVDLVADSTYTFTYVYDMTQTHMEEFHDLRVACFLQTASGEILQSSAANVGAASMEPGVGVAVDYMPTYICSEDVPAGLRLIGAGGTAVNSVEIEGKVGSAGTPVVRDYTVSLEWGESLYVAFDGLKASAAAGSDTVFFQVTKVNGEAFDGKAIRRPVVVEPTDNAFAALVEGFTSAKDKGSAELNKYLTSFVEADDVRVIKFPMSGDKYTRTAYTRYAAKMDISAAPGLAMNGYAVGVDATGKLKDESYFESLFEQVRKTNSIMNVKSDEGVRIGENGSLSVVGRFDFESAVDGTYKLYLFVVESETKLNVGTNGETQFTRLVQAIFPDENGNTMRVTGGKGMYVLSRAISTSKVENYDNLSLVVVVKDADGREVLQTAEFKIENKGVANEDETVYETLAVYPNPTSDFVYLKGLDNALLEVFDLNGRKVFGSNGVNGDYTLDVQGYVPGAYIVKVIEGIKVSTARISVVR